MGTPEPSSIYDDRILNFVYVKFRIVIKGKMLLNLCLYFVIPLVGEMVEKCVYLTRETENFV